MVVSTAPTREQVHSILWEEIRKLHREHKLIGEVQRSDRWLLADGTQVGMGRKPPDHMESAFQGIHRKYVLVIMDEAGGIPAWMWDAVKTITTSPHCRILAIGNPDDNTSEFARVCAQDPTWYKMKISAFDSPNFTDEKVSEHVKENLVSREWVEDAKKSWGEESPMYIAKVLGEFAENEDNLIPLSWVVAANRRWIKWNEGTPHKWDLLTGMTIFGVDVGGEGNDETVIATRKGHVIVKIEGWHQKDPDQIADLVEFRMNNWVRPLAVVDSIGIGSGVVSSLRRRGRSVRKFVASEGTKRRDAANIQGFPNIRSAAWWNMRELLDPNLGANIALPPNDALTADLTIPKWEPVTGGKIRIEPKDSIRKRLRRSTDYGDAVVQAFWVNQVEPDFGDGTSERRRPVVKQYAEIQSNWN
jgi:hypothetical protein